MKPRWEVFNTVTGQVRIRLWFKAGARIWARELNDVCAKYDRPNEYVVRRRPLIDPSSVAVSNLLPSALASGFRILRPIEKPNKKTSADLPE